MPVCIQLQEVTVKHYYDITTLLYIMSNKDGRSLPLRCHPTSSRPEAQSVSRSKKTSSQKIKTPKQRGLRTKEMIDQMTDSQPDYRPSPASKLVTVTIFTVQSKLVHNN